MNIHTETNLLESLAAIVALLTSIDERLARAEEGSK